MVYIHRLAHASVSALALASALYFAQAPAFGQQYQDTGGTHVPAFVPISPGVGPIFTAGHPGFISGSFSLSGFTPTPAYAQLSVGASSARVGLPSGSVVVVYNTGASAAFVTLGNSTVTATASSDVIPGNGWMAFVVGSNTFIAAIETAGTTSLNISGGAGLPTGAGGGGGGATPVITTGTYTDVTNITTTVGNSTLPSGSPASIVVYNTGFDTVAVKLSSSGTAAGTFATADAVISSGGCQQLTVGSKTNINYLAQTNSSALHIVGVASGQQIGCGGGSAGGGPVTAAGVTAISASAVQGVTGGVPLPTTSPNPALGTIRGIAPGSAVQVSGNANATNLPLAQSGASVPIDTTAAGTARLVAAVSNTLVYVTHWDAIAAGTTNVTFEYGTDTTFTFNATSLSSGVLTTTGSPSLAVGQIITGGSLPTTPQVIITGGSGNAWSVNNTTASIGSSTTLTSANPCATGTTKLTGAYPLVAQFGLAPGSGLGAVIVVPQSQALCIVNSAAVQISGVLSYSQF